MDISRQSIKKIKNISNDERFDYFFDNFEKEISSDERELLDELTNIAAMELGVSHDNRSKLKHFIFLGFWSKKA